MTTQAIINKLQASETVVKDRTRMFGYAGGAPNMAMDAKKSGLDCNPIEGGRLLMFAPGKDGYFSGRNLKGVFQKAYVDLMPGDYAFLVERRFRTETDFGFRVLKMLTSVPYTFGKNEAGEPTYEDEAYAYFNVVHPFHEVCPFGLNQKVQLCDPEVGEGEKVFQVCPTCRLADLRSDACLKRISEASGVLNGELLTQLRTALIAANEATLTYVERKSQAVMSDIARSMAGHQGIRATLNSIDRVHLQMMHKTEKKIEDGNVEMMRTFAKEMASALKDSTPVNDGVVISAEDAMILEAAKKQQTEPSFGMGDLVFCDGQPGTIVEVKPAGWFVISLENGENVNARKDKLEVRNESNAG